MAAWSRRSLAVLAPVACVACGKHESAREQAPAPKLAPDVVPRTGVAIAVDGELKEPPWNHRSLRAVLTGDDGREAHPYSELRMLHDDATLYVGLYAADEDIRTTDAWTLTLGPRVIHVDAAGRADAPDVRAAVDRDGTLDQPGDYDEEWVIELAIPLPAGATSFDAAAERCDTPKDGKTRCGRWHARVGLE
ncbi:MAG TPA: hypothetical protein VMJ10_09835 [Kofleriaceae bacterium]|nr:hypothetical protein [Kofleriaceae bacterium]